MFHDVEGFGLIRVSRHSVGKGTWKLVSEFAEGHAEAVDNLAVRVSLLMIQVVK